MGISKALSAITGRDIAITGTPEGHGIQQGFGQNDFLLTGQSAFVPQPRVRPRQIQVFRRAGTQVIQQFTTVHLQHFPGRTEHRHHQ